jgi:hypothetical protein
LHKEKGFEGSGVQGVEGKSLSNILKDKIIHQYKEFLVLLTFDP